MIHFIWKSQGKWILQSSRNHGSKKSWNVSRILLRLNGGWDLVESSMIALVKFTAESVSEF